MDDISEQNIRTDVNPKKKYCCLSILIIIGLGSVVLLYIVILGGCTGGIDGHVRHLSEQQRKQCITMFPNYDFPYKNW